MHRLIWHRKMPSKQYACYLCYFKIIISIKRSFFSKIDEIYSIYYKTKISIQKAIQYGFSEKYLTRPSLNRLRSAYGYSGWKTIIFLKNTEGELIDYPNIYWYIDLGNYEFAQVFWSFVMEKMNPYDLQQRLTRVYWRLGSTSGGTYLPVIDIPSMIIFND